MSNQHVWHKSSYSNGSNNNCVEVAEGPVTAVRDTQNRQAGHLSFSASEWQAFLDEVRTGRL
ncbi:uncharacterized protein DUF397 [Haloactinospora alba]|uniref:Uncharacterized protein DUF397 n=1 Tax=Haloactinospora alba TaxID=405555 RepID=A0A543NEZ3_9ACTN|nr:DUF397 domain-containing protein [Haloactinospora alba]TQN30330.1 uncharacterized protein DUF397 [Haloactinospora alba]